MNVIINGNPGALAPDTTLAGLLRELDLGEEAVAVAVNEQVVPRGEHQRLVLRDGDVIEIIHAVAGG